MSREWSNVRQQWGAPVGKHDAVAQILGRMTATAFAMEAVNDLAAGLSDQGKSDIRLEAAIAKMFNSEGAWRVIDDCMQIRGGRGYETAASLASRGEEPVPVERAMRGGHNGYAPSVGILAAREAGYLMNGGGHAMAAGVTLRKERLAEFRAYMETALAADVAALAAKNVVLDSLELQQMHQVGEHLAPLVLDDRALGHGARRLLGGVDREPVLNLVLQFLVRAVEHDLCDVKTQDLVCLFEQLLCLFVLLVQFLAHPYKLRTLSRENVCFLHSYC